MLVVISNSTEVANEATIINELFDEGLKILHMRKPGITIEEMKRLLEKIKPQYYQRVALHQHHELASDFGINRLHYSEVDKKPPLFWREVGTRVNVLSTSIHQVKEYKAIPHSFEYAFFGPLFDSISKVGYTSTLSDDFVFPIEQGRPKVIAIGGIEAANIQKAVNMNFDGVATLGTIWKKPEEGVRQFKTLQKAWEQTGR